MRAQLAFRIGPLRISTGGGTRIALPPDTRPWSRRLLTALPAVLLLTLIIGFLVATNT